MSSGIVTVYRCYSLAAFDAIKAVLESNGIRVYPDSETTVAVYPWYANALGGLRVKVDRANAEQARSLITSARPAVDEEEFARKQRGAKRALVVSASVGLLTGTVVGILSESLADGVKSAAILALVAYLMLAHLFIRRGPR